MRPSILSTTRPCLATINVGATRMRKRSVRSGRSSISTCNKRTRLLSFRVTWAIRLSIRRAGPELTAEKKMRSIEPPFSCNAVLQAFGTSVSPRCRSAKPAVSAARPTTLRAVGLWYWLGVALGLGAALGIAIGALLASFPGATPLSALVGAIGGYALAAAFLLGFVAAISGAAGGIVGGCGSSELARRTVSRGGTRLGTAILLFAVALVAGGLAFVPALGYFEAVLLGIFTLRLLRGGSDRFAGLRTLARD